MRSDLVFGAMANVSNRYQLTMLAAKAIRKFHRPNTRIQETANEVLVRFSRANPIGVGNASGSRVSRCCVKQVDIVFIVQRYPRSRFMDPQWARFLPTS